MKSAFNTKDKEHSKGNLKFAGPLNILVIEAKSDYCKTVWCAIGLGFANAMIGAVNMAALLYSVEVGDVHPAICTAAVQLQQLWVAPTYSVVYVRCTDGTIVNCFT
ncbi:hypothetical protein evm_011571 [Chilo suppressalis]|nr:hypothetical protein evm_011571 [Chilo suppressalis]